MQSDVDRYFQSDVIGIIEADANFRIARANVGAQRMLGFSESELCARTWMDVAHRDDLQKTKEHFTSYISRRLSPPVLEVRCLDKGGAVVTIALNVHAGPAGDDGRPAYYVGFMMDISRQKKAEADVESLNANISRVLGDALESRDSYTAGHQGHVAEYSVAISAKLGMNEVARKHIYSAAAVHDIGKIGVPIEYLTKTTALNDLEWAVIKAHAKRGHDILMPLQTEFPVAEIVYQHHERLDGSGYPRGLRNGEIMREAQILACGDIIDSMIHARPYRSMLGKERTIEALQKERGLRLSHDTVDAAIELVCALPS